MKIKTFLTIGLSLVAVFAAGKSHFDGGLQTESV